MDFRVEDMGLWLMGKLLLNGSINGRNDSDMLLVDSYSGTNRCMLSIKHEAIGRAGMLHSRILHGDGDEGDAKRDASSIKWCGKEMGKLCRMDIDGGGA